MVDFHTIYAPGRAELLGNHTDYNEGFVLAIAVDRGITLTGRVRDDHRIRLHSAALNRTQETGLDHLDPAGVEPWTRYVLGVVDQFRKHNLPVGGFEAEIASTLPLGAGLSSSAALENATSLFLLQAFGGQAEPIQIARLGQLAENEFVGVRCGLLDQTSSLMSQAAHATFIDCRSYEVRRVPLSEKISIVLANSNAHHELVGGEYNERRADCEAAAQALGVPALRDATTEMLHRRRADLSDRAYRRALHITGENERVQAGIAALEKGDVAAFGRLMFASHESSRHNFENSCPELDLLVEAARTIPGILGARLSGGGFGGATINLVEAGREDEVVRALVQAAPATTCIVTRAADGALLHAEHRR